MIGRSHFSRRYFENASMVRINEKSSVPVNIVGFRIKITRIFTFNVVLDLSHTIFISLVIIDIFVFEVVTLILLDVL